MVTKDDFSAAQPLALVYRGPASRCDNDGCSEAVFAMLQADPHGFNVQYIGPDEALKLTATNLAGAALYAQPGGDNDVGKAMNAIGKDGATAIQDYVANGGCYLGICMGAYMAGEDPGLGLLAPGDTGEYIHTPDADVTDPDQEKLITITWRGVPREMYVQDPSYITPSGMAGERILATYSNGLVAAETKPYGSGRVGVVGPHPEADQTWITGAPDNYDLGFDLVNDTLAP